MRVVAVFEVVGPSDSGRVLTKLREFVYNGDKQIIRAVFFEVNDGDPSETKLEEVQTQMRFLGAADNHL